MVLFALLYRIIGKKNCNYVQLSKKLKIDHISSLFTALSWYQTKITPLQAMEVGVLSELLFAWFYITSGFSGKTLRGRGMFVFSWFAIFHFLQRVVQCAVCVLFLTSFACHSLAQIQIQLSGGQQTTLFNFDSSFNEFNLQPPQVGQIGENRLWKLRYYILAQISINKLTEIMLGK